MRALVATFTAVLVWTASNTGMAQSSYGRQAIDYLTYEAQRNAQGIRSAKQFTTMDTYQFCKNFINYRGYQSLPPRLLASKAFQKRVESFPTAAYWSPKPDASWVNAARQASINARRALAAQRRSAKR